VEGEYPVNVFHVLYIFRQIPTDTFWNSRFEFSSVIYPYINEIGIYIRIHPGVIHLLLIVATGIIHFMSFILFNLSSNGLNVSPFMTMFLIYPFSSNREYDSLNCLNLLFYGECRLFVVFVWDIRQFVEHIIHLCLNRIYFFARRNLRYLLWSLVRAEYYAVRIYIQSVNARLSTERRGIIGG
jgi:hypothetical protein